MTAASSPRAAPAALSLWLMCVAGLVFVMVVVGGITRLTESGLSITEWKPVTGALPPLNDADWIAEFEKYRRTPEYLQINRGMSMADFQFIYFWEWAHRLLGRIIGLSFAVPLAWFAARRMIPAGYGWRLVALLALGGMQGAIGWWMVASGLVNRTDVSHYRLAVHLVTALIIIGGLVWTALDLRLLVHDAAARPARMRRWGALAALVLLIQLIWGAYVAGLNAGYVASDWPLMQGRLVPDGIEWDAALPVLFTSDPYFVHFLHRWWAWGVAFALLLVGRAAMQAGAREYALFLFLATGVQIALGIATVLSGINITLAVLHQAGGAALVIATACALHAIGRTPQR